MLKKSFITDKDFKLWVLLRQARTAIYKARARELAKYNITAGQAGILFVIRAIGNGATPAEILRVFVTQGSVIGIVGTVAGMGLGILLSLNLEGIVQFMETAFNIKFLAADVYFISDLPADLRVGDVLRICSISLVLALLSTVYPAWRGARTAPAEALRYE